MTASNYARPSRGFCVSQKIIRSADRSEIRRLSDVGDVARGASLSDTFVSPRRIYGRYSRLIASETLMKRPQTSERAALRVRGKRNIVSQLMMSGRTRRVDLLVYRCSD